eukprot:4899202-Pyramimonas_sp.AAC.1
MADSQGSHASFDSLPGAGQQEETPSKRSRKSDKEKKDSGTGAVKQALVHVMGTLLWSPDGRSCEVCSAKDADPDPVSSDFPGKRWAYPIEVMHQKNEGA